MSTEPLPDKLTKLTKDQAIRALAEGYLRVIGRPCDAETLAILVAKTAFETGHWQKMHHYNWGNVKRSGSVPWTMYACSEYVDVPMSDGTVTRTLKKFYPPHKQTHFRVYESAADGAEEYIAFLAVDTTPNNGKPNRYAKAWTAAENDDPAGFAHELKAAGYYTDTEAHYTKSLVSLFKTYLPACREYVDNCGRPRPPAIDKDRVLDAVALTLDRQVRDFENDKSETESDGPRGG